MYNVPCRYMYIPQYTMLNIYVYMYTYVYMYIPKYQIPNTQYQKRTSKDPVSANISPQY